MADEGDSPSLIPTRPNLDFPNFFICDEAYGRNLIAEDCLRAVDTMPAGSNQEEYAMNGNAGSIYQIPQVRRSGECYITVDVAGPYLNPTVYATPDDFKALAYLLIAQCVIGLDIGGFATKNFQLLYYFALSPMSNRQGLVLYPPPSTNFFTVSVASYAVPYPGDYDPAIPSIIANGHVTERDRPIPHNTAFHDLSITYWTANAQRMTRGGGTAWYDPMVGLEDNMEYECDANLGSPATVDCTQIEWNQLGSSASSDTVAVSPDSTTFWHHNTCYLAISVSISLTLTWAQIRAAVATLMNICVQNPLQPARGGRAFYHQTPIPAATSNRRRKKKKRDSAALTGLNALPPAVNVTMFRQDEAWTDPTAEMKSCTWAAVRKGQAVSTCPG